MRRLAFALMLILGLSLFAWPALAADGYSEKLEENFTVHWDGSANVLIKTTYYGPSDMLNQTKESIIEMGIENATHGFVQQEVQAFAQKGITLVNTSGEIIGYNTTGPLVMIIRGVAKGLAKYYSYDGVWEIDLDLLRVTELSRIDPTKLNQSFDFDNYYVITLPEGAQITEVPPTNYSQESSGSYLFIQTNVSGNVVKIHSHVHLAKGVTMEDLNRLYGTPQAFIVQYKGRPGSEGNYTKWVLTMDNQLDVEKDKVTLYMTEKYIEPTSYISYLKLQILYQGEQKFVQSLYQSYAKSFQEEGATIQSWNITLENLNSTGPLVVHSRWVLTNYTKYSDGVYTYTYDPTLGLSNIPSLNRIKGEINQTTVTKINLPDGAKFTELPKDIDVEANGSRVIMKVEKINDRQIVIKSQVFIRYGMKTKDYSAMMAKVPTQVEFKYSMGEKSGGSICGPALLVGLIVMPLLIRRRR